MMRVLGAALLLSCCAFADDATSDDAVAPPLRAKGTIEEGIRGGVEFLVKNQNKNGSFGKTSSKRPYQLWCEVPGGHQAFQSATTSLCWLGLDDVAYKTDASRKAQERCLKWLVEFARVKRAHGSQLYNTWAFAYGLHALSQAYRKNPRDDVKAAAEELLRVLAKYQTPDGGWGYYDFNFKMARPTWSTSFSTATMVVALKEAERAGLSVSPKVVSKALKNIAMTRKPDGTYLYGLYLKYSPLHGVNRPQGASLRVQACNLALSQYGSTVQVDDVRAGLEMFHKHHRFAVAGVGRPIPHESHYAVSGYFYLYGQRYASSAMERLPVKERPRHAKLIAEYVLKTRRNDGSFWDYPVYGYHRYYGTGYALMSLARCQTVLGEQPVKKPTKEPTKVPTRVPVKK